MEANSSPTPCAPVGKSRSGPVTSRAADLGVRGIKESAGRKKGNAATGHGNRYLTRVLGEAPVSAGKTDTFLGEREALGYKVILEPAA